jgi:hypothetical protein
MLSSGCATKQIAAGRTVPNYSPDFLDCVADEMEARKMGPCVDRALQDWVVMSGL